MTRYMDQTASKVIGILVLSALLVATMGTGDAMARRRRGSATTVTQGVSISPSYAQFGEVNVGTTSAPVVFTLTSVGTEGVVLDTNTGLVGTDASDFIIASGTCTAGTVLASGQSCTSSVQYSPTSAGNHGAELDASSNGIDPVLRAAVWGTGI